MKDLADNFTQDAFKRGRGRPRTSTSEKKAADTAARMRAYRRRNAIKKTVFDRFMAKPSDINLRVLLESISHDQPTKFQVLDERETPVDFKWISAWEAAKAIHERPDYSVTFRE